MTWTLFLGLALCFANFPPFRALPSLVSDAWDKLAFYRLEFFSWREFAAVWAAHVWQSVVAVSVLVSSLAAGSFWASWRRAPGAREDRFLLNLGIGAGISGLCLLGLGLCGLLFWPVATALLAAGIAATSISRALAGLRALTSGIESGVPWIRWLLGALISMGLICLVMALAPEGGWDPAYYHLRLPKIYALNHKIFFVAHIYPSHYPQTIEMLYLLAWLPGGEGAAKLVNFFFWPLCGFALLRLASPFGRPWALLAATLALTMPLSGTLASQNYIDLGLSFFQVLALRAAWSGDLLSAGLLLGFAMGSKYTGIVASGALGAALLFSGFGFGRIWRLAAVSALPVVPWLARNMFFTGDPVAPFLFGWLGKLAWAGGINQTAMVEVIPKMSHADAGAAGASVLLGLWRFLLRPWFGIFSPFVLGMFPALIFPWRGYGNYLRIYVLAFTLIILLLAPDGRYWQPAAMPLCVLIAGACRDFSVLDRPIFVRFVRALAAVSVIFGVLFHGLEMHSMFTPLFRSLGLEPDFHYEDRLLQPAPWYSWSVRRLNASLTKGERIAVISDVQAYVLNGRALFDCDQAGAKRWVWEILRLRKSEAEIARQFRQWNVRKVLVIRPKARALVRSESWDQKRSAAWVGFWNSRARLLHDEGDCAIYELDAVSGPRSFKLDLPGPQEWLAVQWRRELDSAACRLGYRRAISSGIESAGMHAEYAAIMSSLGRHQESERAFASALRIAPDVPGLWFMLARARLAAGDLAPARAAFERGVKLDPLAREAFDLSRRLEEAAGAAEDSKAP